jgi:hypothetical protein
MRFADLLARKPGVSLASYYHWPRQLPLMALARSSTGIPLPIADAAVSDAVQIVPAESAATCTKAAGVLPWLPSTKFRGGCPTRSPISKHESDAPVGPRREAVKSRL